MSLSAAYITIDPPVLRANDLAKEAKRTTVTAQDVVNALKELEFDEFVPSIETCLAGLLYCGLSDLHGDSLVFKPVAAVGGIVIFRRLCSLRFSSCKCRSSCKYMVCQCQAWCTHSKGWREVLMVLKCM